MSSLAPFVDKQILVITSDGRTLTGLLRGFDQTTNLILSNATERIFQGVQGGEGCVLEELGLYLLRGENVALVGEVDGEIEKMIRWGDVVGDPIKETKVFA